MSEMLREVDEAMRAEKWAGFWHEHKSALITGLAALILGTGFYSAWNSWTEKQNRKATTAIMEALKDNKSADEIETLGKNLSGNAKAIALLNATGILLKDNKTEEALELYQQIINEKSADVSLKQFATIQKVSIEIDSKDSAPENLIATLTPIAADQKSAWQLQAIFLKAFVEGEKNKNFQSAITGLQKITNDRTSPPSLQNRAKALMSIYQQQLEVK